MNVQPWRRFEEVVAKLFSKLNFEVEPNPSLRRTTSGQRIENADLLLTAEGFRSVVEIKAYRSRTPRIPDLQRAASQLIQAKRATNAEHAILVINLRRDKLPRTGLVPAEVTLLGFDDLLALADGDSEILSELIDITRELNSGLTDFDAGIDLSPASEPISISMFFSPSRSAKFSPPPDKHGAQLVKDLLAIEPGNGCKQTLPSGLDGISWRLFEKVGRASLEYVFENEFGQWQEQKTVAGDHMRPDVLAKVTGDDVFSRTLIEDFRSRFLLFEFKNYSDPIGPNLVHITEKYLFPTALRSTVVFVSPYGLSDNAQEAARGALRDASKLVLDIPVKLLCKMLLEKDGGTSGGGRMEVLLNQFLLSLGR